MKGVDVNSFDSNDQKPWRQLARSAILASDLLASFKISFCSQTEMTPQKIDKILLTSGRAIVPVSALTKHSKTTIQTVSMR